MPFSVDQFLDVFRRYNEAVWPTQWVLVALALVAVLAAASHRARFRNVPVAVLVLLWLWIGVVYHALFFRAINPAAIAFAALFVLQAGLLAWFGLARRRVTFRAPAGAAGATGVVLMTYALLVYPLLGWMIGHRYPAAPTFGLPCPTTIFTFGLFLWAERPFPRVLLVIPAVWSVIATLAAFEMGMVEDFGLVPAAILAIGLMPWRRRPVRARRPARPSTSTSTSTSTSPQQQQHAAIST